MPQQFENPANVEVHARTTAAGDPGRLSGGHRRADHRRGHRRPHHRLRAGAEEEVAEAEGVRGRAGRPRPSSPAAQPSPHPIQGIGAGFIPKNLDTELLDGVIQVDAEAAREMARRCAARRRHAGRHLVRRHARRHRAEAARACAAMRRVLGFNYDTGERYLSIEGFLPA